MKIKPGLIVFIAGMILSFAIAYLFASIGEPQSLWLMETIGVM